jgi:hypothetical protein
MRFGGPRNWSGQHEEEKILPLSGLRLCPLGHPASTQLPRGTYTKDICRQNLYERKVNNYGTEEDYTTRLSTICTRLVLFGCTNEVMMGAIQNTERNINLGVW